ncbi:YhaI family protein [Mesobacillus maritimus]|uniref:DUF1878 family protein n=1 Tax=Mesobacillus maritimus TaxID=1643336 RepID=UPI00203F5F89|nr:DUF1878 family protein [Mesobacillus maritimus]MCM3667387.1 YhaI family protein [Mesobacillus maritimus]
MQGKNGKIMYNGENGEEGLEKMNMDDLMEKMKMLEFHQKLLLKMVKETKFKFNYLVIEKSLTESEMGEILYFCERMSKRYKKQKAEGFVYFHPLYDELYSFLQPKLEAEEVIDACLEQELFVPLMTELKKYSRL